MEASIMSINTNHENKKPFNGNKKFFKKPKTNPNEIKAPLIINKVINEDMYTEILDILASTKFNKVSIPIGMFRALLDSNVDADDARVTTVGYIRNYNAETKEFTVVIFKGYMEQIKKHNKYAADLVFTEHPKGGLGTITKFTIYPVEEFIDEASVDENTTYEATVVKL
jgi:hypothetical protein